MEQERQPFPIAPAHREKVWGQFRDGRRLGEIWFPAPPLLLKFLFTSDKLSVQVHPGDAYALEHENSAGKTECWYVVETEPGCRPGSPSLSSRLRPLAAVSRVRRERLAWSAGSPELIAELNEEAAARTSVPLDRCATDREIEPLRYLSFLDPVHNGGGLVRSMARRARP